MATVDDDVKAARCLLPITVYPPGNPIQSLCVAALIDTGASESAITAQFAALAGLQTVRFTTVIGSGGSPRRGAVYCATVEVWKPGFDPHTSAVVLPPCDLVELLNPICGIHMLIGMDVLKACEFRIGLDGRWTLKF